MRTAEIIAAMGAPGSGKSAWVRRHFLQADRTAIWDFKREYHDVAHVVDTLAGLIEHLKKPRFKVAFRPSLNRQLIVRQFDMFCRAVYAAGNCTMLVEELAFVTSPMKAPEAWRLATLTGRTYTLPNGQESHLCIVGTSQRPASVDKDFFGNCTLIHAGRCGTERDARTMGDQLGVPWGDMIALPDLAFVEKNRLSGATTRGMLQIGTITKKNLAAPPAALEKPPKARISTRKK